MVERQEPEQGRAADAERGPAADDRPHLKLGRFRIPLPRSRAVRVATGAGLVAGGLLGFLPVLGLWMLPAGILVLSNDSTAIRRLKRRGAVWWGRRREESQQMNAKKKGPGD
jgi:hypothetical protein